MANAERDMLRETLGELKTEMRKTRGRKHAQTSEANPSGKADSSFSDATGHSASGDKKGQGATKGTSEADIKAQVKAFMHGSAYKRPQKKTLSVIGADKKKAKASADEPKKKGKK